MSEGGTEGVARAEAPKARKGIEDRGTFGLFGLTGGILAAFAFSFYVVVPAMMKDSSMNTQTLVTIVTLILTIVGGGAGYYLTRRPGPAPNGPAN